MIRGGRGKGIAKKMFRILPGRYTDKKPHPSDADPMSMHAWAVAGSESGRGAGAGAVNSAGDVSILQLSSKL